MYDYDEKGSIQEKESRLSYWSIWDLLGQGNVMVKRGKERKKERCHEEVKEKDSDVRKRRRFLPQFRQITVIFYFVLNALKNK